MASIYPNKKRTMYRISFTLNGKRDHKPLGLEFNERNKAKAEAIKKKMEKLEKENKMKMKYGAIAPEKNKLSLKLSDASIMYMDSIKKTVNGKQDYHSRTFQVTIRQFFKTVNPERKIVSINKEDIFGFVKNIKNEISNASVRTYLRYLKGFFNYLVECEIIEKSPVNKRVIPKAEIKPIKIFDDKNIDSILIEAKERDNEYFKIYKMLLLTGIRPCDLFEIKAGNIDLEEKILQFKVSKTQRTIDFPIYKELKEFFESELPGLNTMSKGEKVFKKYCVERIGKTFRKILKELGLKNESYNLKTFRKTFASIFADKGLSEGDLADLLGHTSTNTTRQYYKRKNAGAIRNRIEAL